MGSSNNRECFVLKLSGTSHIGAKIGLTELPLGQQQMGSLYALSYQAASLENCRAAARRRRSAAMDTAIEGGRCERNEVEQHRVTGDQRASYDRDCRGYGSLGARDVGEVASVAGADGGVGIRSARGDGSENEAPNDRMNAVPVAGGGVGADGHGRGVVQVRGCGAGEMKSDSGARELSQCSAVAYRVGGGKHPLEKGSDDDVLVVCGDRTDEHQTKKPKRRRQMEHACAAAGADSDDLLHFLDVGRDRKRRVCGNTDAARTYRELRHLSERNVVDMRAIARESMSSVKRSFALRERVKGKADINERIDTESDDDDLVEHIDCVTEKENSGRSVTPEANMDSDYSDGIAAADRRNTNEDLKTRHLARAVLAALKYRNAVESEKAVYKRSRPDGAEDAIKDSTALGGASYLRSHRERNRERMQSEQGKRNKFGPVSVSDRAKALARLQEALGPAGLEECVCVSCDELVLRRNALRKGASDWRFMNRMRQCLGEADETLPQVLIDAYSAPVSIPYLKNVLVAPNSFRCFSDQGDHPTAWFTICKNCNADIERGRKPKFAISNGFTIGALPEELTGLTLPERILTQLVTISAMTRVMRGGRHRCIRSHCIAFDCTPGPPVALLPRSISEVSEFRVAIVGDFTEAQMKKVKGLHQIRTQMLSGAFDFYSRNNIFYSDVSRNDAALLDDIDYESFEHIILEHIADEAGVIDENVREELENIRGHSDGWRASSESDELSVVERRIGLSDAAKELVSGANDLGSELEHKEKRYRAFYVKRSNQISSDASGDLLAKLFPHLFPFGRGHPGDSRKIPVSVKECVKHYTMLSGRQFAEDELFTLVVFDRISMMNMYTQNSVRCQRFPNLLTGFESIGSTELEKALLENEQRARGQRSTRTEKDSIAHRFLKSVEIASAAVWGSNAERAKCRQKAFAYQMRFGQPSLFMTLTPNTDNSLVMAHYAEICSVASLFDILDATMPTKAELREASLGNDCASTRLFMRNVDAFIEHVLGINPCTHEQMPFQGLIGTVEAYFGMVETQGRGTLHIHLLVWIKGVPSSIAALENELNGPGGHEFQQRVQSYIESVVSNNLPLPVELFSCVECGASYSELVGLAIPQGARQNPRRGKFSAKLFSKVVEPALVQCGACKTKFSSQHVLRNVLLQSRPLHWPPWEHELTATEIDGAASKEVVARNSFADAIHVINEREKTQMLVRSDCNLLTKKYGLDATPETENLGAANAHQMKLSSGDNDPFQNDEFTRFIEALPPMLYDARMGRVGMDYMVSLLVVLLNQHWWTHTSSCFKQSRSTVNESFCRYLFPRDRTSYTTFDLTGASLERKIAHEFVNGFNYEIMATFKCNHDIQFLLGGRNVSDRIHYCTKYVTKRQKRLDSVVVMALASFQRRQVRELQEECEDEVHSTSWLTKSRKRVASMVYTMTSRQEVAGPLAALYLYRGSCCYESSRCSFVPLHDIVHQLCASEEHSCSLVNTSNDEERSRFQAVSFLDDYIYRPDQFEHVNIYEFAMKFFRKKDIHALTATHPFKSPHPLHHSHSLGKRLKEVVPVIQGFRLPFVTDSSPKAIRYKRAILALVLFKSFRTLEDLIDSQDGCEDQWLDSYEEWRSTCSEFVNTIMDHIDDYYSGEDLAKARVAEEMNEADFRSGVNNACASEASDGSDSDDSLFDGYDLEGDVDVVMTSDDNFVDPWDMIDNTIIETETLDPSQCPTSARPDGRTALILQLFKTHSMLERSALHTVERQQKSSLQNHLPTVEDMRKWVQDTETDNKLRDAPQSSNSIAARDTKVVELLDEALVEESMTWWNSSYYQPSKLRSNQTKFASISHISRMYTLNQKQHHAFKMIGRALLVRWQQVEDLSYANSSDLNAALHRDQLRCFLGGEGGTGKSRVLDAVEALCESWNRADCLIKTALTGKAATMISGRTLASFLLQLKKKRRTSAIYLDILVIDEVSMMKKYQLAQLDKSLRHAKRVPTVPFGGIHVVLVGDFLQLPPVGGEPLYRCPAGRQLQNANEIAGYQLWLTFDCVVMLEESVRFRADPEWGRGCKYARKGIWLPEFVDLINSRIPDAAHALDNLLVEDLPTFITPDNSTRLSINNLFISTAMNMMPDGEYPVRIVANFKGHLGKLGKTEVKMIMSLPDTKFGRMAPYLDLIVGMPIQITQNIRATKMAANGTLGSLEEIIYQPNTTVCVVLDSAGGFKVKIPSLPPVALVVRIRRGASAVPMQGCTDSDLFPLFSDARPYNQCDIKLPPSKAGIPRHLSLRIEQFPLVCAIASTVYKVQGETLNNMVVTEWRSDNRLANKREQPYLLVSRVTSRYAFRALHPLTDDVIRWARPSKEALEEDERLQRLSGQILQNDISSASNYENALLHQQT